MKLIVGLGNPGEAYRTTRHNLGFLALDRLADVAGISFDSKKKKALWGRGAYVGEDVFLLKPQTFMNLSGEAVLYLASFFHIATEDVVVVCDDINLAYGAVRIRKSGSAGGHNGLKSLIASLGSEDFVRIRLGVGERQDSQSDLADYVLSPFTADEMKLMPVYLDHVTKALSDIIQGNTDRAMNQYNGRDCTKA